MDEEVKKEFEKVWKKIEKLESVIKGRKNENKVGNKKENSIIEKILNSPISLSKYPVDKFKKAGIKCLLVLKLVKDLNITENLLTSEMKTILIKKLRAKEIPSMTAISNAMKKAEKNGLVVSVPFESGEKRQRKYKITEDGEIYLQNLLVKNGETK